jgi:hypothetical protein
MFVDFSVLWADYSIFLDVVLIVSEVISWRIPAFYLPWFVYRIVYIEIGPSVYMPGRYLLLFGTCCCRHPSEYSYNSLEKK